MNRGWTYLITAVLMVFAGSVLAWQLAHRTKSPNPYSSVIQNYVHGRQLAAMTNMWEREFVSSPASYSCRNLDLILPDDVHIFMADMTGPTNYGKIGYYFWMTYYMFPREVGTSLDHKTAQTKDGLVGVTSGSDEEILAHGFQLRMDADETRFGYKILQDFPTYDRVNPRWFNSRFDEMIAFFLPLATALAGMWLLRLLFPALSGRLPVFEQLAYAMGLGMMAVAAIELGMKLCGFHGRGMIFLLAVFSAIAEILYSGDIFWKSFRNSLRGPVKVNFAALCFVVFLALFRLAGLAGLMDADAMRWMLKAKIIFLSTGRELVHWFSDPAFAHAHLDYPTLVPSLHAATYDSIGHVDEFVTKFWPAWMLLFLIAGLASLCRVGRKWLDGALFALFGFLLLPAVQTFVQWEGSTMPMIFFTVLGCAQCALWLVERDRARLGLGLTMLFGAAMTKFEGFIFLGLAGGWLLLMPSTRPSLRPTRRFWLVLAFIFLSALPFLCLRLRIPVLNYESNRMGEVLHQPAMLFSTLADWFWLFVIEIARLFADPSFGTWSGDDGQVHLVAQWSGLSSLYNPSTLGLPWLCLLMTIMCWIAIPERRRITTWMFVVFLSAIAAVTGVFASFVGINGLRQTIGYTNDEAGGRYLLPILLAWFGTMLVVCFANGSKAAVPGIDPKADVPDDTLSEPGEP